MILVKECVSYLLMVKNEFCELEVEIVDLGYVTEQMERLREVFVRHLQIDVDMSCTEIGEQTQAVFGFHCGNLIYPICVACKGKEYMSMSLNTLCEVCGVKHRVMPIVKDMRDILIKVAADSDISEVMLIGSGNFEVTEGQMKFLGFHPEGYDHCIDGYVAYPVPTRLKRNKQETVNKQGLASMNLE